MASRKKKVTKKASRKKKVTKKASRKKKATKKTRGKKAVRKKSASRPQAISDRGTTSDSDLRHLAITATAHRLQR